MKQRLVGTLVLGCLALIFIPLLLDGEGISPPLDSTPLPPEPQLPSINIAEPERPVILADTRTQAEQDTPAVGGTPANDIPDNTTATADEPVVEEVPADTAQNPLDAETTPTLDATGLPEAWVVRLGSFGNSTNADALLQKLLDADYKAFRRPVQTAQGPLTGIYIGPVLTRDEARTLIVELSSKFQLNGIVEQFSVNELQ